MTEEQLLNKIHIYVKKELKLNVQDPDYNRVNFYSPQWRCYGSTMYYQLPNGGVIIGIYDRNTKFARFSKRGIARKHIFGAKRILALFVDAIEHNQTPEEAEAELLADGVNVEDFLSRVREKK